MWPQLMHILRWTHRPPERRHSSQPTPEGATSDTEPRCEQALDTFWDTGTLRVQFTGVRTDSDRSDPRHRTGE